jgi:hypothetical protein
LLIRNTVILSAVVAKNLTAALSSPGMPGGIHSSYKERTFI